MAVKTRTITVEAEADSGARDITSLVAKEVKASDLKNGIITIFVAGSTGGVTTIEFESGVVKDLSDAIERIAPQGLSYRHDARWGDGNGYSHVRSALVGPSLTVPFSKGELLLGTWQQIVLFNFDNRPRSREVILQIIGEP